MADKKTTEQDQSQRDPKDTVAVALTYNRHNDPAPRIAASGKGPIAEQILKIAEANGIEIRQDAELADILSKLEIDSLIPLEAYAAVAEILSYVYRANQGAAGRRPIA